MGDPKSLSPVRAAAEPPRAVALLRNPYHGTSEFGGNPEWAHTWFHGTRGEPDFGDRRKYSDEAQRATLPPDQREMNFGWTQPNQHLGVHFSPLHEVAHKFVGSVSSTPGSLVHAQLHFSNPAVFGSEEHLNIAMADWASKHYPHWHDEKLNGRMSWNYGDNEGTHRDFSQLPEDHRERYRLHQKAQDLLTWHPHMPEILNGFRRHLEDQGHHGIVYGNGLEGPYETDAGRGGEAAMKYIKKREDWPRGHPYSFSAIAHPDDIHITHVEHIAPWREEPQGDQRTWEDASDNDEPDEMRDKILDWHRQHGGKLPFKLAARRHPYTQQDWYHGGLITPADLHTDKNDQWLHVGTQAAALRRMDPREWDPPREFPELRHRRLYRVRIAPGATVCPHMHSDGMGGLEDPDEEEMTSWWSIRHQPSCRHGEYDVHAYRNDIEDPGSTSLVVRPSKITSVEDLGHHPAWQDEGVRRRWGAPSWSGPLPSRKYADPAPEQHTAAWQPSSGIFAPTTGLDQRLFEDGALRPQVTEAIMERIDRCIRVDVQLAGSDWQEWMRVYLAGGSASEWAGDRPNEQAQDLDVLVGIDLKKAQGYSSFEGMDEQQAAAALNAAFRAAFNETGAVLPGVEGTWDLTAYCNPGAYDIRDIKPYAAWDLTDNSWAVKPPHLPEHSLADFDPAVLAHARAVLAEARAILRMPEPLRSREARDLWEHLHAHRCVAFSPEGQGWQDVGNVDEKMLAYAPGDVLGKVRDLALSKTAKRDRWQSGECGTYATALQRLRPDLRIGGAGDGDEDDWDPEHFFAHDNTHAYDSEGRHPLPWSGRWQHSEMDINPDHFDVLAAEHEPDSEEAERAIAQAQRHAVAHDVLGHQPKTAALGPAGPLYHGSMQEFGKGTILTPGARDADGHRSIFSGDYVYATTNPEAARYFGSMHDSSPLSNGDVHVHRVEPVGEVEPDEFPAGAEDERYARGNYRAKALRVVDHYMVPGHWAAAEKTAVKQGDHLATKPSELPWGDEEWASARREPWHAAAQLAQEQVRWDHPRLSMPFPRGEDGDQMVGHILGYVGYKGDTDGAFVARHPHPEKRTSNPSWIGTRPGVALHPDKWDYGTVIHEAAHHAVIYDHAAAPNEHQPDEQVHGPEWASHYAQGLNKMSPGAGDDFLGHHQRYRDMIAEGLQYKRPRDLDEADRRAGRAPLPTKTASSLEPAADAPTIVASAAAEEEDEPYYYHVSPHRLPMGTILRPPGRGRGNWDEDQGGEHVYVTPHEDRAHQYHYLLWEQGHPDPHIYYARPHGTLEQDPNDAEGLRTRDPVEITGHLFGHNEEGDDESEPRWFSGHHTAATGYDGLTSHSGMIYLEIPEGLVRQVQDGVDDHHITICYLGKNVGDEEFARACLRAREAATQVQPLSGVLRGIDTFEPSNSSDGKVPAFVPAYIPGVGKLRQLLEDLSASEHRHFRPHCTLGYYQPNEDLPAPHPPVQVRFSHLHVKRGDDVLSFPLGHSE